MCSMCLIRINFDIKYRDPCSIERVTNVILVRITNYLFTNFSVSSGKLTAVIGRVGSGKSSFLSALLGEMKSLSGLLKWEK